MRLRRLELLVSFFELAETPKPFRTNRRDSRERVKLLEAGVRFVALAVMFELSGSPPRTARTASADERTARRTVTTSFIQFRLCPGQFEQQRLQLATVFVRRHGGLLKLQLIDLQLRALPVSSAARVSPDRSPPSAWRRSAAAAKRPRLSDLPSPPSSGMFRRDPLVRFVKLLRLRFREFESFQRGDHFVFVGVGRGIAQALRSSSAGTRSRSFPSRLSSR